MYSLSLHEKKRHGTRDFPAEYYYVDGAHPRYQMPFHWHREWELIRVRQGRVCFRVGEREQAVRSGELLLVPAGMLHGGTPDADSVYECLVFDLEGLFRGSAELGRLLAPFVRMEYLPEVFYVPGSYPALCAAGSQAMDACRREGAVRKLLLLSSLGQFFGQILAAEAYGVIPAEQRDLSLQQGRLKAVFEYIERAYAGPVTLEMMAEQAGLSSKYLCAAFRELTHHTPMEYVILYRIEQACILLADPALSVTEVALRCGFNDSGYFAKRFRAQMKLSPTEYRKVYLP